MTKESDGEDTARVPRFVFPRWRQQGPQSRMGKEKRMPGKGIVLLWTLAGVLPAFLAFPASAGEEHWNSLEMVAFRDFDDLTVKINGKNQSAFLIGLAPLSKGKASKEER